MKKKRPFRHESTRAADEHLRAVAPDHPFRVIEHGMVSDAEAEKSDVVVCILASEPTDFIDNVFTYCADCGEPIQHRPHAPKRPKKVCIRCAEIRVRKAALQKAKRL